MVPTSQPCLGSACPWPTQFSVPPALAGMGTPGHLPSWAQHLSSAMGQASPSLPLPRAVRLVPPCSGGIPTALTPCPGFAASCQVSTWSAWSPCSASCGGGISEQSRHLLDPGESGSQDCPGLLLRLHRPCNTHGCAPGMGRDAGGTGGREWGHSPECHEGAGAPAGGAVLGGRGCHAAGRGPGSAGAHTPIANAGGSAQQGVLGYRGVAGRAGLNAGWGVAWPPGP